MKLLLLLLTLLTVEPEIFGQTPKNGKAGTMKIRKKTAAEIDRKDSFNRLKNDTTLSNNTWQVIPYKKTGGAGNRKKKKISDTQNDIGY